jgi:tRNA threonylcarbamoyladenosine biosynthesis protein TsaB
MNDDARLLILETSCSVGQVALAKGSQVLGTRLLDEARRHARDLIPAVAELLKEQGWRARDLNAVLVSRGPGSYTGLRVGIMTAKSLAYATGCVLLGIDTFAAIARQAPEEALRVDVISDAQKDKVYVQRFVRGNLDRSWQADSALAIQAFSAWQETLGDSGWISGPGIKGKEDQLRGRLLVDPGRREPLVESLLQIGRERWDLAEKDDIYTLEPLYLRPSAAEEQWQGRV